MRKSDFKLIKASSLILAFSCSHCRRDDHFFLNFFMRYSLMPNAVTLTRDVPERFDQFPDRIGQEELVGFFKMKFCCL